MYITLRVPDNTVAIKYVLGDAFGSFEKDAFVTFDMIMAAGQEQAAGGQCHVQTELHAETILLGSLGTTNEEG